MSIKSLTAYALISLAASGCSTITSGTTQNITVVTQEVEGAECELIDSKGGRWYVKSTPNSASVSKGDGPMTVICKKEGYKTSTTMVEESFAGATLGNILLGGGIGIFVDAASGAAQKYPDSVDVWIEPVKWASESEQQQWISRKQSAEKQIAESKAAKNQPPRSSVRR